MICAVRIGVSLTKKLYYSDNLHDLIALGQEKVYAPALCNGTGRRISVKKNFSEPLFQYMLQTHFQDGLHMIVRQGIEDILAFPAEFDQLHLL